MPEAELDARVLPKPEKHKTIFATFAKLAVGESFVLLNDHEPEPLRLEFEREHPGSYGWEYLEKGRDRGALWRTRISRLSSTAVPWILTDTTTTGEGVEPDPAGVVWKLDVQSREIDADVTSLSAGQDTGMHVGPEIDALIHVLSGSGRLTTELGTVDLTSGALLWMPRRSRRQFISGPDGLRYLTIHQKRQFLNLMATG
ncbi:DUF2249 domain-containing protein [Mycolicibacter kumamotonensis]|jgi:uncharacterized protein (DUF2249 family)|uniref:DUF2249 domain-containing protein n=1 Tax=Mycolicibacter kumamotonensis TaxID=354243 RepID=A0A1B8SEY4_9MYCO|nr:DUF2249 domain-containing protein [Mycolicibacter kumamotonensis]NDJ89523.1 DUF2249 domain-containing protein [Mycolicibacter kumamotonensis]OBY31282.1 hypothetical protein ACT18_13195 [Mycolicibacter kumamotonensis]ORA78445.1 hypothetical protein BST28_14930 [Mycolicibacter kumamotonensis]